MDVAGCGRATATDDGIINHAAPASSDAATEGVRFIERRIGLLYRLGAGSVDYPAIELL